MCAPLDLGCHAANAVADGANSMLEVLVESIKDAIASQIVFNVTWWVAIPSPDVESPAQTLQDWMLPITAVIATGGILWQALLMVITRKGEPMVNVVKGIVSVALWGAVAVAGTNALLRFGDLYSIWVLTAGLDGNIDALSERLIALLVPASGVSLGLVLLIGPVVAIAAFVQLALMFFRGGAVIILTGLLQLAAAGGFTGATSGWLRKVLSWHLALIFYKPLAATMYAVAFMLMGDEDNSMHVWLIGVGMLGMTIIALPAMLRFLSWMVGGIQSGSGGLGMLAGAAGAGMHAAASMRGVTDQAKDMDNRDSGRGGGGGGPSPPSNSSPSGSANPSPTPPSYTGPAPTGSTTGASTGTGAASSAGASTAGTAGAATGGAGATAGAATGGAAAGGAAAGGAAAGGAAAAGAATGPAAPVVAGVVMAGQAVVGKVKQAADETTKDGG